MGPQVHAYNVKCPRCGKWTDEHELILTADADGVAMSRSHCLPCAVAVREAGKVVSTNV